MNGPLSLLETTFGVDAAVSGKGLCLVMSGTNAGNAKVAPTTAGTKAFVGVSTEKTASNSKILAVAARVAGVALIQTDGSATIAAGDTIGLSTTTAGQIKKITPAATGAVTQVVGVAMASAAATAGILVPVLLQPSLCLT